MLLHLGLLHMSKFARSCGNFKNWRNRKFCQNKSIQLLEEEEGCPAKSAISAIFPKNAKKKIGKIATFAKINNSSVRKGRRLLSKICVSAIFSKNCENLEKSHTLLTLISSSVRGAR